MYVCVRLRLWKCLVFVQIDGALCARGCVHPWPSAFLWMCVCVCDLKFTRVVAGPQHFGEHHHSAGHRESLHLALLQYHRYHFRVDAIWVAGLASNMIIHHRS